MKLTYEVDEAGTKTYRNAKGQWHRTDGPALEYANGTKIWYRNDKLHRTDGPAVENYEGTKIWYRNDKLHRTDGPAVEYTDGSKYWYLNDEPLTEAEFNVRTRPVVKAKLQTIEIDGVTYKLIKA